MPNFIKVYSKTHQIATSKKNWGHVPEPPSNRGTPLLGKYCILRSDLNAMLHWETC